MAIDGAAGYAGDSHNRSARESLLGESLDLGLLLAVDRPARYAHHRTPTIS
jgi:hypothetical protein